MPSTGAASGTPPISTTATSCLVQGDIDGNGKADFEILVKAASLAKGDFFL
jgi:hypothetical protein